MVEANTFVRIADHALYCKGADGLITGCQCAYKDRRVRGFRALLTQVVSQSPSRALWQGQDVLAQGFSASEHDRASAPVDVAQLKFGYFTAAQPQVQRAAHDGVAT